MAELIVTKAGAPGSRTIDLTGAAYPASAPAPSPTAAATSPRITLETQAAAPPPAPQARKPLASFRPSQQQRPAFRRPSAPPAARAPPVDPRSLRGSYQAFANANMDIGDDDDDDDDGGEDDMDGEDPRGGRSGLGGGQEEDDDDDGYDFGGEGEEEEEAPLPVPGPGFSSLDDEKSDIIVRLSRLAKRNFKSMRSFSMVSDISEMRVELLRLQTEADLEASIRFQRRALVACSSGLEFVNKRYGKDYAKLDGWSETVHEECASASWDGIFERLFLKYRNKTGSLPPELELIIGLVGSAGAFHWSQAMSAAAIPELSRTMRENPQLMEQIMRTMAQGQQGQQGGQPQQQQGGGQQVNGIPFGGGGGGGFGGVDNNSGTGGGRPEMAPPPGFGGGGLFGGLSAIVPSMPMPAMQTRKVDRPAPRVEEILPEDGDDQSDHLSDVISEELASLDLSSDEDVAEVRSIALPTPRRKAPSPSSSSPSKKGTGAKKSSILRF